MQINCVIIKAYITRKLNFWAFRITYEVPDVILEIIRRKKLAKNSFQYNF